MTLLSDVKDFLKRYFRNPFVRTAVAFLLWKIIDKQLKKMSEGYEGSEAEGLAVKHRKDGTDFVVDLDTGIQFLAGDTDFKIIKEAKGMRVSEKISKLQEKFEESSDDDFKVGDIVYYDGHKYRITGMSKISKHATITALNQNGPLHGGPLLTHASKVPLSKLKKESMSARASGLVTFAFITEAKKSYDALLDDGYTPNEAKKELIEQIKSMR